MQMYESLFLVSSLLLCGWMWCAVHSGWNMHLVRTSSFLLGVLLIITILCSHTVYHAATSDQLQCLCCCPIPKNSFMTNFQRGCWNNAKHIWKIPLLRFLCTSQMSREKVSFFWLKNLELKSCRNLLYGPYNMQFSFLSACCWRRAMRVLMQDHNSGFT